MPAPIEIDDSAFFPDAVVADSRGQLYVGSAGTGAIMRASSLGGTAEAFTGPSGAATLGLALDEVNGRIWRCRTDLTFASASAIEVLDLQSGESLASHALPAGAFCNGVALNAAHDAYATDSVGQRIFRVRVGDAVSESPAEPWLSDHDFEIPPGQLGLNGLSFGADGTAYVSDMFGGRLFGIASAEDGAAGLPELIDTRDDLTAPDGILSAAGSIFVTEFASGELSRITSSGAEVSVSLVRAGLAAPTSVAVFGGTSWVVESQVDHLFDPTLGPPTLPFVVTPISLCPEVQVN